MNRRAQLRGLSDDHHTALVVAARCKRVGSGPELGTLWERVRTAFATHFEPHFRIEEDVLLPALEGLGEGLLAARIRDEHARLRALAGAPEPAAGHVRGFGELLERHVRFEEREVFEATQDRLPDAVLADLERACAATPRTCAVELVA